MGIRVWNWKVDRDLETLICQMMVEKRNEAPGDFESEQLEINAAMSVLVEAGIADLMRDKRNRPYWGRSKSPGIERIWQKLSNPKSDKL